MRWGLIARAEDRGLGTMTWELAKALGPDRVLVVDMSDDRFDMHLDRFPGATVTKLIDGHRLGADVDRWADGLDVVYSAETLYDWTLPGRLAARGCATVVHGMPEFYGHGREGHKGWEHPTRWWWPTGWLMDQPRFRAVGSHVVPVPVQALPVIAGDPYEDGPLRISHVVGHRANADRNGTLALFQALRRTSEPVVVDLWTQDARLPIERPQSNVTLNYHLGGVADRWEMYRGAHLMVLPRRYGGLCLPVHEAMGSGLAVMMPDVVPNLEWPVIPVACTRPVQRLALPCGHQDVADVNVAQLAYWIDRCAQDRDLVAAHQAQSLNWAGEHSWAALASVYLVELEAAARTLTDS